MKEDLPPDPAVDRLHRDACEGCAESRLLMSRRAMLGVSAGLFSWAFMPRFAEAADAANDPRLLVVVLRGGMDGISTVVPFGDPHYVSMRGGIAIPAREHDQAQQLLRPASRAEELRRRLQGRRGGDRARGMRAVAHPLALRLPGQPGERPSRTSGERDRLAQPPAHSASGRCPDQIERGDPDRRRAAHPARTGAGARLVAHVAQPCGRSDALSPAHALPRQRPDALRDARARHQG